MDLTAARQAFEQAIEYYESLHHPGAEELRARLNSGLAVRDER